MANYIPSNVKNSILAFIKNIVSKSLYNDIKILLNPCCTPVLTVDNQYACTGSSYTIFSNVTVETTYKNKNAILLFTFTGGTNSEQASPSLTITLDSTGKWSGDVTVWDYFADSVTSISVQVILEGSQVLSPKSNVVTLTDVPNCD